MVVVETRAEIGFRIPLIVLVGPESEFRAPHPLRPES